MSHEHIEQNTEVTKSSAINAQQILDQAIVNIERLHDVYHNETEALKTSNTEEFLTLQAKKFEAAQHYQTSIEEIIKRKNEMKDANPETKEKLIKMQQEFSVLAERNMASLSRMKNTVNRLGMTIRKAAASEVRKQMAFGYSETGALENMDKKRISTGINENA